MHADIQKIYCTFLAIWFYYIWSILFRLNSQVFLFTVTFVLLIHWSYVTKITLYATTSL